MLIQDAARRSTLTFFTRRIKRCNRRVCVRGHFAAAAVVFRARGREPLFDEETESKVKQSSRRRSLANSGSRRPFASTMRAIVNNAALKLPATNLRRRRIARVRPTRRRADRIGLQTCEET